MVPGNAKPRLPLMFEREAALAAEAAEDAVLADEQRLAVETAAKCAPTAVSPSASTIQRRAVAAFVIVSTVVKVFDATMNSVVSGSSPERVS